MYYKAHILFWALLLWFVPVNTQAHEIEKSGAGTGFISNKGQWDNPSKYLLVSGGTQAFMEIHAFQYFFESQTDVSNYFSHQLNPHLAKPLPIRRHAIRVSFEGASDQTTISGNRPKKHHYNFFTGNQPQHWQSEVPVFGSLYYQTLYEGIDMEVYETKNIGLKYDILVRPYTSPQCIKINYKGAEALRLKNGNLMIRTSVNEFYESKPIAYQIIENKRIEVPCRFILKHETVSFEVGDYNPAYTLVIDPQLVFSTYSGSSVDNFGHTATYDNNGNLYAAGIARNPTDFPNGKYPVTAGAFQTTWGGGDSKWPQTSFPSDIAISKYNNDGSELMFATYLGGSKNDYPLSLVVDPYEQLIVLGVTNSENFPIKFGAVQPAKGDSFDLIVTRFTATGSTLVGSTYIGGNGIDGINIADTLRMNYSDEFRGEVQVTREQDVILVSSTTSTNLNASAGAVQTSKSGLQDGLIVKLDSTLSNIKALTYLGQERHDALYSLDLYPGGDIIVAGGTQSLGFSPGGGLFSANYHGGISDGFVARLNGNLTNMSAFRYWGSAGYDQAHFVKLDQNQQAVVTGQTYDSVFATPGVYRNDKGTLFITKFSSSLNNVVFSTQIGGATPRNALSPSAFMVDVCGRIYGSVWGGYVNYSSRYHALHSNIYYSSTNNLPITPGAYQPTTDGSDFYLYVLSPNADSLSYATYFGEYGGADHVDGGTSRFDKRGIVYQSVCASCNFGTGGAFPTTAGSYSPTNKSPRCSNASFKFDFRQNNVLTADFSISPRIACSSKRVTFTSGTTNALKQYWFVNGVLKDSGMVYSDSFPALGNYDIKLVVQNPATCNTADTLNKTFRVLNSANASLTARQDSCGPNVFFTSMITTGNGQPTSFIWYFGDGDTSTAQNPVHVYGADGTYFPLLIAAPSSACADTASTIINYNATGVNIVASFLPASAPQCEPYLFNFRNTGQNGKQFFWYINQQEVRRDSIGFDTVLFAGKYQVSFVAKNPATCEKADTQTQQFVVFKELFPDFTATADSCELAVQFNNTTQNPGNDTVSYYWNFGDGSFSTAFSPKHYYADTGLYYVSLFTNRGLSCANVTTYPIRVDTNDRILEARFTLNPSPACEPLQLKASNNSINATHNYWYINGAFKDSLNFNLTDSIKQAGTLDVRLVIANPNTCKRWDTLDRQITVYPAAKADFIALKDKCSPSVTLINKSSTNSSTSPVYNWDFGDGQTSSLFAPTHVYDTGGTYLITLITNPGTPCADTAEQTIAYRPDSHLMNAEFDVTDSMICIPAFFKAESTGKNGQDFKWYINGNLVKTGTSYADTLKAAQTFSIKLVVVDTNSCKGIDSAEKTIRTNLFAEADFLMKRDSCSLKVLFENRSGTGQTPFVWYFGDGDSSKEYSPKHDYAKTDYYKVQLIYSPGTFCADTAESIYFIDGDSATEVFIPNVFTPNNDGINDCYRITGVNEKCDEFHILVYNRWGNLVYESTNGTWCWDGKSQSGEALPQGIYYYVLTLKKKTGYQANDHGTITLLRE